MSRYVHYDSAGRPLDPGIRVESAPRMTHKFRGITHFPYLPLTVEPAVAADSASILILRQGDPVIERYDLSGRLVERIAWTPARRAVTQELYRGMIEADLQATANPQQKALFKNYYDQRLPLPELVPAYRGLKVDETRHIWVERYRMGGENERVWDVISPDGRWLGPVKLPGRFWLHRAGRSFLVGTQMDSMDVEQVQVYDLRRSP